MSTGSEKKPMIFVITMVMHMCRSYAIALLAAMVLPAHAAPANAPQAGTTAPAEIPVTIRLPPAGGGANNSKTPTEIQVSEPGQPSYTIVIPPAQTSRKSLPVPGKAAPACAGMKAPYRAGLWEITSISNNSLMPQPITAKIKRCVTDRDAQNACGLNQLAGGRNRDCQLVDMQITSNTATWGMRCESAHFTAQGSGQSTFTADAYHGKFDMSASTQGTPMQMNTTFNGRRLGNCK